MLRAPIHPAGVVAAALALVVATAAPAVADPPPVNGALAFQRSGALFSIGTDALTPEGAIGTRLTTGPADRDPAWSPAATKLAFSSRRAGNADIWSAEADGSQPVALTADPAADWAPTWSPDGGQIAFTSRRSGTSDVWVMGADGAGQSALAAGPAIERQPAWSPDGSKLAFASDRSGRLAIWVVDRDGANPVVLASVDAYDADPAWSPDGRRLAFAAGSPGATNIVTVDGASGGAVRFVTTGRLGDRYPAWSPDGKQLAFSRRGKLRVADVRDEAVGPLGSAAQLQRARVVSVGVSGENPDWAPLPVPRPPEAGDVTAEPKGPISVQVPTSLEPAPLTRPSQLPEDTMVDASQGKLVITSAAGPDSTTTAVASGGRFTYAQTGAIEAPTNVLKLPAARGCRSRRARIARPAYDSVSLNVRRRGRWRVRGPHVIGGSHATDWVTVAKCTRTIVRVRSGLVKVRDLVTGNRVSVPAGRCYVAPSREPRARRHCS